MHMRPASGPKRLQMSHGQECDTDDDDRDAAHQRGCQGLGGLPRRDDKLFKDSIAPRSSLCRVSLYF